MMPTLSDVAKVAGVGVMSVSRVVNGTRKVSSATERKVREAIERIGYEPNEAARMLKGQRAHVLGLIVPDLADPFFATCANAVHETAWKAGYLTLMAASFHNEEVERRETEIMLHHRVAGIVVIPSGSHNTHFAKASASNVPIVSLDRPLEGVDADVLIVDNRAASASATEHLIGHGHRQILCIADDEKIFTKSERVAGYSQAMRSADLPIRVVPVGPISGPLHDQLNYALHSNPSPTAIFATSDVLAIEVLKELQQRCITVSAQMALISFDDFDAAKLVRPAITVVRQPVVELARRAASLLLDRVKAATTKPSRIMLQTQLILRESCGCINNHHS
jgi:LacI family transcriptional regulator